MSRRPMGLLRDRMVPSQSGNCFNSSTGGRRWHGSGRSLHRRSMERSDDLRNAERGTRNAEYQGEFEEARTLLAMPHSDFRIPHSGPMRIGRIGYINCYPVYGAIDRGLISPPGELVTGTPAELNDLLVAGELDVSVISAVEYARHARDLVLLPDLAISCDGPVRSVMLLSRRPVAQLDAR